MKDQNNARKNRHHVDYIGFIRQGSARDNRIKKHHGDQEPLNLGNGCIKAPTTAFFEIIIKMIINE